MIRIAEPRSNFPRALTAIDIDWSLEGDQFRDLCIRAMTSSQAKHFEWEAFGCRNMDDIGFDWAAELERLGYWLALSQDDGSEIIALASSWREASDYAARHGDECCFMVRLNEEVSHDPCS